MFLLCSLAKAGRQSLTLTVQPTDAQPSGDRAPRTAHEEAFSHYLRTGERLTTAEWLARQEVKFNPWHDRLGRFTFGPGGASERGSARDAPPGPRPRQTEAPRPRRASHGHSLPAPPTPAVPVPVPGPAAPSGNGFRSDLVRSAVAAQTNTADTYFELNKRQAWLDHLRAQAGPNPSPSVAADLADFQTRLDANRALLDQRYRFADAQVGEILRAGLTPYDVAAGAAKIASRQGTLRDFLAVSQVVPIGAVAAGVGKVLRGAERVVAAAEPEVAQLGGTYRWVRKNQPKGNEAHHLVPDSISPVPRGKAPAISMPKDHHQLTQSWGPGPDKSAYRGKMAELIRTQGYRAALNHEINTIRETFGKTYDEAIQQALEQANKLGIKSWISRYTSSRASMISRSG